MASIKPSYRHPTEAEVKTIIAFWKAKKEYGPILEILKTFNCKYKSIYDFEVKR